MLETRTSVCALDCPDTCSLLVQIDETGHAIKLRGNPDHPMTQGFLCGKVARYLEHEYSPQRLLQPLRRIGEKGAGEFEPIEWDEALHLIAGRLQETSARYGPESVLPYSYAGTMGLLNGSGMDRRFFHRFGASRLDRTICSAAGGEALMLSQGAKLGMEPEQFEHSRFIIAWGANILGTNVHLWPWIVKARRQGARLVVIDPVRNRTGAQADHYLPIAPGSDLALALGMAHIILRDSLEDADYLKNHTNGFDDFSELVTGYSPDRVSQMTGLPASDIEFLAHAYATIRPAAIRVNYGVQRSDRGGAAIRAIAALPVLTGAWRSVGGGLQLTTSGAFEFNRAALERPDLQWKSPLGRQARLINMSQLGQALTKLNDPPVQALVVYNSNPAVIAPDQSNVLAGLRRPDLFTVVIEQVLTDTALFADVVLPATTFLEHTDLYLAYGHYYLQLAQAALEAPGNAKSNVQIFRLLAEQLGWTDSCFHDSEEQMIEALLDSSSPYLKGITVKRLLQEGSIRLNVSASEEAFLPFAEGNFGVSGKFEFGAATLGYEPPIESRFGQGGLSKRFPFELISSKNDDSMNSTFGYRPGITAQTSLLEVAPSDAARLEISAGSTVRVFNDRGACVFTAQPSDDVPAGVVRARTMRWTSRSGAKNGINSLVSDRLTDIGGGPTFYSCLVALERLP